jgi:hypothetical protein
MHKVGYEVLHRGGFDRVENYGECFNKDLQNCVPGSRRNLNQRANRENRFRFKLPYEKYPFEETIPLRLED